MVQAQERVVEKAMIEFVTTDEELADFCRACGQRFCGFCNECDIESDGICCTCRYQFEKGISKEGQ